MKRVIIIGGGITGLAAAHRLLEIQRRASRNIGVLLLEADSRLGGIIKTYRQDGFVIEAGPDSFISEKPEALELSRRIGLEPHLIETNKAHRRSFIVRDGRLRAVPEGFQLLAPTHLWPFIKTDLLSWTGKGRMVLDLLLPRRPDYNGTADESLANFVRRRFGREAFERLAQPMVAGIYSADPEKLSLRATFPRFPEMEHKDRSVLWAMLKRGRKQTREEIRGTSGARYSLFLSFDQGMQVLVDRLVSLLPAGSTQANSRVESLAYDRSARQWNVRVRGRAPMVADAVCIALPSYSAAELLHDIDAELAVELNSIPYASTATINLAYARANISDSLDGFGFVVPFVEKRSILACTFSSVKFNGRSPQGYVLLRAFIGGALQPEVLTVSDEEVISRVRSDLRNLLGVEEQPLFTRIEKWPHSMPQYHVGHLERISRIQQRLNNFPTLKLAGNAYSGPGIPDCVRSGETAAEEIERLLQSWLP